MDEYQDTEQRAEYGGRLIPIMREGVEVIKLILFKKLKSLFLEKYDEQDAVFSGRLAGVIINTLFGTPNQSEPFENSNYRCLTGSVFM